MPLTFHLCPDCLERHRALRFDAAARCNPGLIPFASLVWEDEEPPFAERPIAGHDPCRHSLMLLFTARKKWWRTGRLDLEWQTLWREAAGLLPDWPGFQRLTLSAAQLQDLDACEQEVNEMLDDLRSNSAMFAAEDKGGGVISFIAYPRQSPPV